MEHTKHQKDKLQVKTSHVTSSSVALCEWPVGNRLEDSSSDKKVMFCIAKDKPHQTYVQTYVQTAYLYQTMSSIIIYQLYQTYVQTTCIYIYTVYLYIKVYQTISNFCSNKIKILSVKPFQTYQTKFPDLSSCSNEVPLVAQWQSDVAGPKPERTSEERKESALFVKNSAS